MLDRNIPPNAIGRQTDLFGVTAMSFKALLTSKQGDTLSTDLVDFGEADLMAGDVTVAVDYSTINYKDGMALTGRSPVIQTFPLIGGIDLAGTVEASTYPGIEVGDRVVANRSEEHTSELQSLMRISYAVFCLQKK